MKVYIITKEDMEYGYHCLSFGDDDQITTKQVFFNKTDAENEAARLYEEYLKRYPYMRNQPEEYTKYHPFGDFHVAERTVY